MSTDTTIKAVVGHDRAVVVIALIAVITMAWAYLLAGGGISSVGMAMMTPAVWTPGYAILMFFMWLIMMVAMMLPSAAPTVLLFATINRKQRETGRPYVATSTFTIGYCIAWAIFSVVAVILQWGCERAGILSPMLVESNEIFGAVLVLGAGFYQLMPIKHACLRHCRSPLAFFSSHWRPGIRGALHMGIVHGAFCVGCCWVLMGLLFFGGVMNLYWIAGLALFILLEKTAPVGHWIGYVVGVGLVACGIWLLAVALEARVGST